MKQPQLDPSPKVGDEVRKTTCYMCACRCGINVHLRDGEVRYIEGNRDHPVNQGVLCAKGSAGIMQHYSPARLTSPLRRVGPRGSGQFEAISWDEALTEVADDLAKVRSNDPRKLAFFTGRDQSQALTGWWATQFGTPNFDHGGFVPSIWPLAVYTLGGAFWEFGSADWERTECYVLFGVAEDHDSNPIKMGLGKLKKRGVKILSVNPVQTGYAAVSDDWYGITPGMDGLFILSVIRELMISGKIDVPYLTRYTNAPYLVIQNEGAADHGLFWRDGDGNTQIIDRATGKPVSSNAKNITPDLTKDVSLPNGGTAALSLN